MMHVDAPTFLTIAEIAATFAGFSALVSALGQRVHEDASTVHDLLRLRLVIANSILTVIASLVPIALNGFKLPVDLSWWITCFIFFAMTAGIVISFVNSYQPVKGHFSPDLPVFITVLILEFALLGMLVTIVLRAYPELDPSLYLTMLIITIAQAALVFARLIGSTMHFDSQPVSTSRSRRHRTRRSRTEPSNRRVPSDDE